MDTATEPRFMLQFAPEAWSPPGQFLMFLGPPFVVSRPLNDAIRSCSEHMAKFQTFAELAAFIEPTLQLDLEELGRDGYTAATRSRQFAALVEVLICELYSILDGIRYTLFYIYGQCKGVQKKSTTQLFSRAAEHGYGSAFPEELRAPLAQAHADWFHELRRLRTAFTHGGLGSCMLNKQSQTISYMNPSLGSDERAHVVPDVVALVHRLATAVVGLTREVFAFLFSQLQPVPSVQVCGVYKARIYTRRVAPGPALNRGSGACNARQWFDHEPDYQCPLSSQCKAYEREAP